MTTAYQYADYILNHYDRGSHEDKLCLAKSLIEHGYGRSTSKAEVERLRAFIKSKLPPPPYAELEPEWKYAEKLLAETATLPEEAETSAHIDKCIGNVTTDTPRTDAIELMGENGLQQVYMEYARATTLCRELERELAVSLNNQAKAFRELAEARQLLVVSRLEAERLSQALSFIANDNGEHDSTKYYRGVAQEALNC
jgi:hypothetical protein